MTDLEKALASGGQVVTQAQPSDLERALASGGQVLPDGASEPTAELPSGGESVARGAFQGVTFGFGDELSGAVRSLIDGTNYQQERDAARGANTSASDAHPYLYGGAELAGGLAVPIPGGAGASLGAHVVRAAAAGGLAGLGSSTADLTKGNFGDAVKDTVESALLGGAIGAVGSKIGGLVGKAGTKAEDQAIKALAGGESKSSSAAWQKTRRMVNNPETREILREPVALETASGKTKTTTLEKVAGKEPDAIKDVVDSQVTRINNELRPIYTKADEKNGGVPLSQYVRHLDDQIKLAKEGREAAEGIEAVKPLAPSEARVYVDAINELKQNAIQQWGGRSPNLLAALGSQEAKEPGVYQAILKQFDVRIPSDEVRAEATSLQKIGFKTVDPLNPGLQTQVKRDMGNMVRDFVNGHVMRTLGTEDHTRLLDLNKRANAWLGVGTVAEARAEKEVAGRMSARGGLAHMLGHGSVAAGLIGAAMGHPAALVAPLAVTAIEHAPAASRTATRTVAAFDRRLKAVADQAAAGNPFAQTLLRSIRNAPGGVARLAALQVNATPPNPETPPTNVSE